MAESGSLKFGERMVGDDNWYSHRTQTTIKCHSYRTSLEMLGPRVVCVFEMGKAGHFKLYADKQNFILYMAK